MTDVSFAMQAKSDQLNAMDIAGYEPVITIRDVQVKQGDQPVSVFYHGDNGRPWKPSKGMIRILAAAWGRDSSAWVGKSAQIYCDPDVMYAGQKIGGVRIRALSDINPQGMTFMLTINQQKRTPYPVSFLRMERPTYPQEKFDAGFNAMVGKMQSGEMTLAQIVARCQQTGDLTEDQYKKLEQAAPVEADGDAE